MSVITKLPVTPSRVEVAMRYLQLRGTRGVALDNLMAELSPDSLRRTRVSSEGADADSESASIAGDVLEEIFRLGLAERYNDDGTERVRTTLPAGHTAQQTTDLRARLEEILLNPGKAELTGQHEFPRALAWFLTQDTKRPLIFGQNVRQVIDEQCGPDVNAFDLTNHSRAENFFYWACYLGYAWRMGLPNGANSTVVMVVPDPTVALKRHLPTLMEGRRVLPLAEMIDRWANLCPVLEGGEMREEVEELMSAPLRRPAGMLSRSTSLALERLDRRGVIHLERQPDAPAVMLATWPDPLPVSHITYNRTA